VSPSGEGACLVRFCCWGNSTGASVELLFWGLLIGLPAGFDFFRKCCCALCCSCNRPVMCVVRLGSLC